MPGSVAGGPTRAPIMINGTSARPWTRRAVLRAGLTTSVLLAVPGTALTAACGGPGAPGNPFTLGVASGEPSADGVVLWTRLAPDPLAEDGLGGLGARRTDVEWALADDEGFRSVVGRGRAVTGPEVGHSVHVELSGLPPGREYFYRFRTATELSPVGRTRTAPAPSALAPLTMCFTSCAQYEQGWFTAYARLAEDEPQLVVHLGDYIYEYGAGQDVLPGGNVRAHAGPETVTLAHYRQRHAQYRTDPDLQAAHAVAPWLVVFDDHEVEDDWAGAVREPPADPPGESVPRGAAAFGAYW
jgi:alkaline phosphatase D